MAKRDERLTAELKLRLPEPLRQAIEREAKKVRGRSLNTEIIERLERSLSGLAEEVLMLAYGPMEAPHLIGAYRRGMLRLKDKDVQHIKRALATWVDKFNTALEG